MLFEPGIAEDPWESRRFSSIDSAAATFLGRLSEAWPGVVFPACLDVGCGTGALLAALRKSELIETGLGIDISRPSIRQALDRFQGESGLAARSIDVMELPEDAGPFDLIASDGALAMVDVSDRDLCACLARLCRPCGLLCFSMPEQSAGNFLFILIRRLLRLARCELLERTIFRLGRRIYPWMSESELLDRVPYMFFIPRRLFGPRVQSALEEAGFELIRSEPLPTLSLLKLKHRLCFFRREAR